MTQMDILYRAEGFPVLQNRMFFTEEEAKACTLGDIILVQDTTTGLIFNQAFRPELIKYDANYQNEQALSLSFLAHLDVVTEIILRHCKNRSLIEVGCGKGFFLEHLQKNGFEIMGLDPAYEGTNPNIVKNFFTPKTGLSADGIILRHVLEHVADPISFLHKLLISNNGKGKIYIEVPCFDWICEHHAWFDIFYEHVNYFRKSDFARMFGTIYESGHLFSDQYIYVVAELATLQQPRSTLSSIVKFPSGFNSSIASYADRLKKRQKIQEVGVIWGGASKGAIFAMLMSRAGAQIDMVIDINPAKHGKYLPVTGLRVVAPSALLQRIKPGSDIFLMNSNYLQEVRQLTNNQFSIITVDHDTI